MTCKCNVSQKVLGDGCRYCQPQTYIDYLESALADYREGDEKQCLSIDRLRAEVQELKEWKETARRLADYSGRLETENEALRAKLAEREAIIEAVCAVANESEGIAGWHKNGELVEWDEILPEIFVAAPEQEPPT